MKFKLYRGLNCPSDEAAGYKYHYRHFNADYDVSQETDERGNPLVFIREEELTGEIFQWNPFFAKVNFCDGAMDVFFKCPECGAKSCERTTKGWSDPHWWQGHFKCSNCGAGEFCYYSDCWERKAPPKQLELF